MQLKETLESRYKIVTKYYNAYFPWHGLYIIAFCVDFSFFARSIF